jgi:hypothetical protein
MEEFFWRGATGGLCIGMEQSLIFTQNKNLAWRSAPGKPRSCKEFREAQYSIGIPQNLRKRGKRQLRDYEKYIALQLIPEMTWEWSLIASQRLKLRPTKHIYKIACSDQNQDPHAAV